MNVTGGLRSTSRLHVVIMRLLTRNTSKIAVEVEPELLSKLEDNEIKPKKHPGVVKAGRIELPSHLSYTLERVIGDYPIKKLLKDSRQLNQYISARHPPTEQQDVNARMRAIMEEVDRRMPPEQLSTLNEEEGAEWRRRRENAIRRMMSQRTYAWKPITYGKYESLVYAVGRGAREYSVLMRILGELQNRDPTFKPNSYFDFGSGVGTGMWAASSLWKDSIFEYYNVDSSREMHDLSDLILREGNENQQLTLRNVYYRQFLPALETKYDLVVSSFTLFELPSAQSRKEVILNLWQKCNGYLVVVEEGTRRGSELVNEAREYLLSLKNENLKGEVLAPCPHDLECPRLANAEDRTPCNFEVAYAPLRVGDVHADRHTARYSYVVLRKGTLADPTRKWPRLVRPTLARSKHIICRMCTAEAKLQEVIFTQSKHGRIAYRCAKASRWGDRLPIALGEPFETKNKSSRNKTDREEEAKNSHEVETTIEFDMKNQN